MAKRKYRDRCRKEHVRQPGPCRAEGTEAPCFLSGSGFSVIGSYGYLYFIESDGVIGYKERVLPLDGHASRRSQFAPVIVILTPFPFAAAFFFK